MGLWGKPGDGPGSSSLDVQGRAVPSKGGHGDGSGDRCTN